jgi:hypothetical protein
LWLPECQNAAESVAEQLRQHQIPGADKEPDRFQMAADIETLLEPNPRKIKNFVNGLCAAWAMHQAGEWIRTRKDARRFVLFHYLRQYHRPVWRLLERQPWSLHLLWAVLTGAQPGDINHKLLPGVSADNRADQRLLEEIFFRAFSHVLKSPATEDKEKHGGESLEQAVQSFQQRRDRKRSDEHFKQLFGELIAKNTKLHPRYLYLESEGGPTAGVGDDA